MLTENDTVMLAISLRFVFEKSADPVLESCANDQVSFLPVAAQDGRDAHLAVKTPTTLSHGDFVFLHKLASYFMDKKAGGLDLVEYPADIDSQHAAWDAANRPPPWEYLH